MASGWQPPVAAWVGGRTDHGSIHADRRRHQGAPHRLAQQCALPRPGLILSASIVGSGELIATTLGARAAL